MTFESTIKSADEVIAIDGYNYDSVSSASITIGTSSNVINVYYTKRTDLSYTVNYLEKDTNKVIHDQKDKDGMTYESVVNSSDEVINIYGYNYASVDKDKLIIGTGENVINIYYTKKDAKVTVHYYEEGTTNKVSEDVEITGKVFENYETESASDIPSKYELVAKPENKAGTMTEEEITVIYYYRKKATKVMVHYYEENTTNKLSEDVTIDGRVDDPYTTVSATDVPIKYELVAVPDNANGSMTEETIEVIYYYRVKDAVVNVRYLEKGTNIELADEDRIDGKVDENYETKAKDIEGYQSSSDGKKVIKIGTCGSADTFRAVQKVLDDENSGIYLDVVVFDAYNLPNEALNNGEIDLNSFQHKAYLKNECEAQGYDLTAIGDTSSAPLTLYSKKVDSLKALKELAGKKED